MPLLVTNPTDMTVYLRSFDGDSVAIHPKSRRVKVAQKFNWQIPVTTPSLRIEDQGEDECDYGRIVKGRAMPEPKMRPKGHHNKSRQDPLPFSSAQGYFEKVAQLNEKRAAKMQVERAKIEARFSGKGKQV